jgi:signal transduction histidine kinase
MKKMGSFLPIRWPDLEQTVAWIISLSMLGLILSELGGERAFRLKDYAFAGLALLSLLFVWRLVSQRNSSVSGLVSQLQNAREADRLALSQELHDELGSLLTLAKLDVARLGSKLRPQAPDIAERLAHLCDTLNHCLTIKTRIVEDLRPAGLTHLGLKVTLENYMIDFANQTNLKVRVLLNIPALNAQSSLAVFRIVQESLTNIVRHAKANSVFVSIKKLSGELEIVIHDNGSGFNPVWTSHSIHGLSGMSHRVRALGGRFDISSAAGAGTTVLAFLPLEESTATRRKYLAKKVGLTTFGPTPSAG